MTDVPDLVRLREEHSYAEILQAVRTELKLKGNHSDGSLFGFAYCRYHSKSYRELTGKEWSEFDAYAVRCAAGEQLPLFVFSFALISLYGARVH